ncbi:hypothetical protein MTR_7g444780 [Medicago truncatula]|uniref:Envelope-like protein n=1 Tax=Medicago truncatula TaxID=3880 RepID=A0A072U933_MEDTR|nr:hypothetical protein MTR_7g444780 [Medicago truncatula]
MKFKNDPPVSSDKNSTKPQKTESTIPKRVEPLTTIPPSKSNKKTVDKSTSKKKKTVKKGEPKVPLSMTDLNKTKNSFKAAEEGSSDQTPNKDEGNEVTVLTPDVATPVKDQGNPNSTLNFDEPVPSRKLGLEVLNDAIDSTENMDVSKSDNETGGENSIEGGPKETLEVVSEKKELNVESDPEEEVIPEKSVEKSQTEEVSRSVDEEADSDEKDSGKDVLDVDKLDMDEVPLEQIIVDSVAKRLRSNKGKVVPTSGKISKKTGTANDETPKNKAKMTGVGPKKSWSKVMVKGGARSSRKRKVVSSSESEYDAEMDVLNITSPESKKADGKKDLLLVEDVPIDKRWKFIYHRRLALERELSEEALKIEEVMSLNREAGLEKTVCKLGECYEKLVRQFLVNIPNDCDNPLRRDYQKLYVRGKCVNFSPNIINNFLGVEGGAAEVDATDNHIFKEIATNKVQKLFGDSHAPDLVGTSVPTSNAGDMLEKEIIVGLKATSVVLGERKTQIDLMILAMERKVVDNVVDKAESEKVVEEAESEKGGEDEVGSGDEDENTGSSDEDLIKEGEEEKFGSISEAEE